MRFAARIVFDKLTAAVRLKTGLKALFIVHHLLKGIVYSLLRLLVRLSALLSQNRSFSCLVSIKLFPSYQEFHCGRKQ